LAEAGGEHNDAAQKSYPTEYGRNINILVFICTGVDWPDIEDFFTMGVGKSLIDKGKTAENNEENATPNERFHICRAGG
jgi:hypothetical protein